MALSMDEDEVNQGKPIHSNNSDPGINANINIIKPPTLYA
ncbi:hypothetical protein ES703_85473 [subsurface metagenome]